MLLLMHFTTLDNIKFFVDMRSCYQRSVINSKNGLRNRKTVLFYRNSNINECKYYCIVNLITMNFIDEKIITTN